MYIDLYRFEFSNVARGPIHYPSHQQIKRTIFVLLPFPEKKVLFRSMDQPYERKDDGCQGTLLLLLGLQYLSQF